MNSHSGATRDFIRVLVADSNQTESQLLTSALRRQQRMRVAYSREELADCLVALRDTPADVAILRADAGDQDRLVDTIRSVHGAYPNVGLVLLLDSYDRHLVVNAMRAGARGLFCKASQPFRALCRCISVVHQGQFWANTEQVGYIIDALNSILTTNVLNAKGEPLLSEREGQLVNFVAEGLANRNIAELSGIKENSVKKALLRIYDKLGVSNRVELVLYVLAHRADSARADKPPRRSGRSRGPASFDISTLREVGIDGKIGRTDISRFPPGQS
jgi:DNA-binding NarL/FixJ family response regulator